MSADSPRRSSGSASRGVMNVPAIVPPQVVSDRSILDSAIGFINEVTLAHQPPIDPKDTITWARFETAADISDPRFGEDWELEGNVAPPLLLILGYGFGIQVWAIPANGEAVEVLSWRHGIVSALRVLPTPLSAVSDRENGRADEPIDAFAEKRPLIALVDGNSASGSQPQFCAVNFISLKTAAQVKTIKFKNPVIEILANRFSIVITFHERIAVFDARTLEDLLSITTCYPSPGINPNPATLGPRWLAYAENKLLHSKRSGGGCDGDGVASYTATVLNASKSLVKGLRELGEQVAAGLTGTSGSAGNSKNTSFDSGCGLDTKQAGIVTIIDVKNPLRDYSTAMATPSSSNKIAGSDAIIAHFIAHSEALVAMEFDNSGMLLVTADRRGHDFHVFRIQPNPVGSSLAAVHHLYILHRGDTSAKVQNIALTLDSRWVAVSTLRGTTHVFPITPYGGAMGVRTHTSLHVVNKLSRFHRSAGISGEARSNSPISHSESTTFNQSLQPYHNSTLPPFPRPTVVMPLAQLRQPFALGSPPGSTSLAGVKSVAGGSGSGSQRQRLSSLSDDSGKPLSVCAIFAKSRSWLLDPPNAAREAPHRMQRKAVDSLFVMAGHGALIQYDLGTKLASNVAKEKICDDTPIELEIEAKAQWNLGRRKEGSQEIMPPLLPDNWLIKNRNSCMLGDSTRQYEDSDGRNESWLAQVEIITHAGPHRRLWMGPQFVFKTYNTPSGSNLNHVDIEAVEIGTVKPSSVSTSEKHGHSSPLNMPLNAAGRSSAVPVLIESGSYSSIEQSPKLMDRFRHDHLDSDYSVAHGDSRLKEDLADAMREPPAIASSKDGGGHACVSGDSSDNVAFYDALTAEDDHGYMHARSASAAALASVLPNIHSYDNSSNYEPLDSAKKQKSIEKIVNPLGTVTTVTSSLKADVKTDILDEVVSQLAAEDTIIHENCDESLFRPVVAIFCDEKTLLQDEEARRDDEKYQPPEIISSKLIVPVIAKEINDELSKREKEKCSAIKSKSAASKIKAKEQQVFEKMSLLDRKSKEGSKTIIGKGNVCTNAWDEKNNSKQNEPPILNRQNQGDKLIKNIHDKEETGCSKNTAALEKATAEIKETQKIRTKKELHIKGNHLNDLHEQTLDIKTDVRALQKKQTKMECRNQTEKELQDCVKENKDTDLNVQDIAEEIEIMKTKYKTKLSSGKESDKKGKMMDSTNISKENIENQTVNKGNVDQQETLKAQMDAGNVENKSEPNCIPTSHNSTKTNTVTKEKVKKTKDTIKSMKLDTNNIVIGKQLNAQQLTNELDEIEKSEKNFEGNEAKVTRNEAKNEETILTNLSVSQNALDDTSITKNESRHVEMDLIKDHDEFKTSDRTTRTGEQQQGKIPKKDNLKEGFNEISKNHNSVKINTSEKNKAKFVLNQEQLITESDVSSNKELNATINIEPTLDDNNLKEIKSDPHCLNAHNKYKSTSLKTKPDEKAINKEKYPDTMKQTEEQCEKNNHCHTPEEIDITKKIVNKSKIKMFTSSQIESKPKKLEIENEIEKKIDTAESIKKCQTNSEAIDCELVALNANNNDLCKAPVQAKVKQDKSNEMNTNPSITQQMGYTNKDIKTNKLSDIKPDARAPTKEIKANISTSNSASPPKKGKEISKAEVRSKVDLSKKNTSDLSTFDKENKAKTECSFNKELVKENKKKAKSDTCDKELHENTSGVSDNRNTGVKELPSPPLPPTSVWKILSGADIINKNFRNAGSESNYPLLGAVSEVSHSDKLLPELLTPINIETQTNADEVSVLKSLDSSPPQPALEPLQLMAENKSSSSKDISLITFESPLLENPSLQRKITSASREFMEQNLIFALCGSLHYENEHNEKTELSPTFSSNHSSTAFEDNSLADYKSLTENDDLYMSLEQSSQDTNTNTTNTTNEKFSSSTNSSGSEEIVIMEEKKMSKKQKRKKQQQLKESQKQNDQNRHHEVDDEELRPLIAMTSSQVDQGSNFSNTSLQAETASFDKTQSLSTQPLIHSTTTDSEGPLPATTSDENVFSIPVPIVHNPHKIKTKKLEHKINLIAAIEAATSSSTSSAEESGVDLGCRSAHDNGELLISVAHSISTSTIPRSIGTMPQTAGALKKKTKRRKR